MAAPLPLVYEETATAAGGRLKQAEPIGGAGCDGNAFGAVAQGVGQDMEQQARGGGGRGGEGGTTSCRPRPAHAWFHIILACDACLTWSRDLPLSRLKTMLAHKHTRRRPVRIGSAPCPSRTCWCPRSAGWTGSKPW